MGRQDSWAGGSSQFLRLSLGTGGRDPDQDQDRAGPGNERLVPSGYSKAGKAHGCVAGLGCSAETLGQGPSAPGSTCPWVHLPWVHLPWGPPDPEPTCPGVHLPRGPPVLGSTCPGRHGHTRSPPHALQPSLSEMPVRYNPIAVSPV